jgi:transposase
MMIIGVDYHPSFQTIAFLMEETGECGEQELNHSGGEAEKFYRDLKARGICVRVGMEATGYSRWFERLLAELGFELWIGDPAQIKAKRVKKQKYDRENARLLLRLMRENNFPQIWVPSAENRDLRQLLWHRHRMVQMRTRMMNQLQALAMNENRGKTSTEIIRCFLIEADFAEPILSLPHGTFRGRDSPHFRSARSALKSVTV